MSRITPFATAFALASLALPRTGGAEEPVVLQLDGPASFEAAGYCAALWQGYYREAGLDVTIRPGGLRGHTPGEQRLLEPVREVTEGRAQFGIGTTQLVIRRAQGLPVLLLAPIFQQSGAAVYYRADSDFSSPAALVNARLGRPAASDILDIELATALRAEGIDSARIKSTTISADQVVPALADHTIDAAIGSAWTVPWQAHERGIVLKSFNPANYRVEYYGDGLFTLRRFAAAEPQVVSRFRDATLRGWEYALRHPDDMIARLVANKPGEPAVADIAGFDRYQADVARRLARYPEVPLGYSNADRWSQIESGMIDAGVLERRADLASFVYNPMPATISRLWIGRSTAMVAAVLGAIAALAIAAWGGRKLWERLPRIPLPARRKRAAVEPMPHDEPTQDFVPVTGVPRPRLRSVPLALEPPPPRPTLAPLINLNDVLGPLERRVRQRVRGKVRCRFSLLADLWPCRAEGGPVAACVLDLVGAATTAADADGTLIVGTRNFTFDTENVAGFPGARIGEFARITVRDSGLGLSETEFEQIFDRKTSVRPAVTNAVAVMDRLGGFVRVESAEGVGTAVHLYLARAYEEAPDAVPTAQVAE